MLSRARRFLASVLIPVAFAIVAIVTMRENVVLATSEKIVGVAIGVDPRAVNEAKSV